MDDKKYVRTILGRLCGLGLIALLLGLGLGATVATGTVSGQATLPEPYLVKDINAATESSVADYMRGLDVDGALFFVADDGIHEKELWKSDGTLAGTVMVKDINPYGDMLVGSPSSPYMASLKGTVYFQAWDGTGNGSEL
jgi:ELWxxDGT repeat protein